MQVHRTCLVCASVAWFQPGSLSDPSNRGAGKPQHTAVTAGVPQSSQAGTGMPQPRLSDRLGEGLLVQAQLYD
jgi:hypothetical protein